MLRSSKRFSNTVAERSELEHAHEFYSSIRTLRSLESIQASIMVEFNKWRESGVVERWSRQAVNALGELGKRSETAERDGQSIVHESGHGVQERGSGCGENSDSQTCTAVNQFS